MTRGYRGYEIQLSEVLPQHQWQGEVFSISEITKSRSRVGTIPVCGRRVQAWHRGQDIVRTLREPQVDKPARITVN